MLSVEKKKLYDLEYRKTRVMENRASQEKFVRTAKGIYKTLKANSAKRGMIVEISREDFIAWYNNEPKVCCYCGIPEELITVFTEFHVARGGRHCSRLTIDRKANLLPYREGNIALSCFRCNSTKSDFFTHDEMIEVGKLVKKKWKA